MKIKDKNIQELQYLYKEVSLQMELLLAKKAQMEWSIKEYDYQIKVLKERQHELGQQIVKLEMLNDYIWANIGEGG